MQAPLVQSRRGTRFGFGSILPTQPGHFISTARDAPYSGWRARPPPDYRDQSPFHSILTAHASALRRVSAATPG